MTQMHCAKYSPGKECNIRRLSSLSLEVGGWGCAPWIALWPILVFFAPMSEKDKWKIFFVSIGLGIWTFVSIKVDYSGGTSSVPPIVALLMVITGIPLVLAYFILSYKAMSEEIAKRKALRQILGEAAWQRLYYCTVHDEVVDS